jgi:predicted outer membrane repeat protein
VSFGFFLCYILLLFSFSGTLWTMARNAPGSFALFGGNSFVYDYIFKLENHRDATFVQNFCASIGGAIASIGVSSPLDTIKTRIQNKPFDSPESGASIFKNLIKNEGPQALFKGLTPKLMVIGPKVCPVFSRLCH